MAPTPNTIPAVDGAVRRESSSGIRSLSLMVHCFSSGSQSLSTRDTLFEKNLASLKASPKSFFQAFWAFGSRASWYRSTSVLLETLSGNVLDLKVGPITLVEKVFAAVRTRSGSTRIFGRLGAIEARIPTTSSLSVGFSEFVSVNPIGLVVKIAVSSRRNIS